MAHVVGSINYQPIDSRLIDQAYNTYSQYGEDGLIDAVFRKIGETNRWCFEVGAADGQFYSNTLRLREQGWNAVLAEMSDIDWPLLQQHQSKRVHCVHERVTDLDGLLSRFHVPLDCDLGIIDIDGQDYWLWHRMVRYQPRVMLVEFHWKDGDDFVPEFGSTGREQAGHLAISTLGASKGYTAVARTHVNLLMVKRRLWGPIV